MGNVIDGNFNNGISLYDANSLSSKNIDIDNNSITNIKSYGIRVANDSFAVIKSSNNISAGISTICLYSKKLQPKFSYVTFASTSFSLRNKPLITLSSVNGNTGYKVYSCCFITVHISKLQLPKALNLRISRQVHIQGIFTELHRIQKLQNQKLSAKII